MQKTSDISEASLRNQRHNRGVIMVAISLAIELLIMTSIGFAIKKLNIVTDEFSSQISALIMNACLPCLVFNSMTSIDFSADVLRRCGMVLLLSLIVNSALLGMGQLYYIASGKTGSARLACYSMLMVHGTFMGVPVIDALFGAEGNMYYAVFMIFPRLLYYGFSKLLLSPPGASGGDFSAATFKKAFLAPSVIVMPFAAACGILGLHLPTPIMNCVYNMSKLCTLRCGNSKIRSAEAFALPVSENSAYKNYRNAYRHLAYHPSVLPIGHRSFADTHVYNV